jgi:hypothetical protein
MPLRVATFVSPSVSCSHLAKSNRIDTRPDGTRQRHPLQGQAAGRQQEQETRYSRFGLIGRRDGSRAGREGSQGHVGVRLHALLCVRLGPTRETGLLLSAPASSMDKTRLCPQSWLEASLMRYVVHPVACTCHTAYQALLDNLLRDLITPFGSAALKARLAKDLYLSIHKADAWLRVGPSSFDTLILQDEGMPTLKLQALPVPPEAIADRKVDIFILPEVGPRIQFQVSPGRRPAASSVPSAQATLAPMPSSSGRAATTAKFTERTNWPAESCKAKNLRSCRCRAGLVSAIRVVRHPC